MDLECGAAGFGATMSEVVPWRGVDPVAPEMAAKKARRLALSSATHRPQRIPCRCAKRSSRTGTSPPLEANPVEHRVFLWVALRAMRKGQKVFGSNCY
mmetsp:Transcript_41900/g.98233  ORF Transcript_41900/g.98233 Transcript_41900/m.98233 type:complete len:98 (-) Transcript_41900:259-552(-)